MKFLDELDAAFDNIMGDGEEEEQQSQVAAELPDELQELTNALAADQSVPVQAVAGNLDKVPRKVVLAALEGSLQCLAQVERQPERAAPIEQTRALLRTSKGGVRKVLDAARAKPLRENLAGFGPKVAEQEDVARYLKILHKLEGIDTAEITSLFASGLWNGSFIAQAPLADVVRLSRLDESKATALQEACR